MFHKFFKIRNSNPSCGILNMKLSRESWQDAREKDNSTIIT